LAAELKQALSAECELIAAGGGVFEISVDGDMVFSKHNLGRFPDDGEVLQSIRAR